MGYATAILVLMIAVILTICYSWVAAVLALLGMGMVMIWVLDAWGKERVQRW